MDREKGRDRESMRGQSPIALSPIAAEALFSDLHTQGNAYPPQLGKYFTDNVYLADAWHSDTFLVAPKQVVAESATWRLKERMKTAGVALVVCLNIGTDPPDTIKPSKCARMECWLDPTPLKQKGLETIGNALQAQYEKWQSKAKYKQCLDPTSEDLRRICMNLRKTARSDRLLFHYNGHGVPKPTKNGELWVFGKHYTHYMPVAVAELRSWLGDPAIYVLDCSCAGALLPHFIDNTDKTTISPTNSSITLNDYKIKSESIRKTPSLSTIQAGIDNSTIVLAACRANESLPLNPSYPADIFTACLTTPISITLRWFILQNPLSMQDINPDLAENIPGKDNDRKTPRGELNWIFTAITDTIAWNTLPSNQFQKMFRQDLLVASLFRNFLLAKRLMKSFNCTPQSLPPVPDSSTHPLWQAWDLAAESCLSHVISQTKGSPLADPRNNMQLLNNSISNNINNKLANNILSVGSSLPPPAITSSNSTFFSDHLSAFEVWLEFGRGKNIEGKDGKLSDPPAHLPILLQVLLSQTHRLRALYLLRNYLALGAHAVNLSLLVGIFPYILKLLQSTGSDIRQVLVSIWASILGFDPSCRGELVRDKSQSYFIQYLIAKDMAVPQRCMAAFVLAEICNGYCEGQQTCLQQGLHRSCTSILSHPDVQSSAELKKWICLCLFKLCEDFLWAKYLCLTETAHVQLYPLLLDGDVMVRSSALLALGEIFGASILSSNPDYKEKPSYEDENSPKKTSTISRGDSSDFGFSSSPRNFSGVPTTPIGLEKNQSGGVFSIEQHELVEFELQLALQILDSCTDGSVVVRREAIIALSKFIFLPTHIDCIVVIAKGLKSQKTSQENEFQNSINNSGISELSKSNLAYLDKQLKINTSSSSFINDSRRTPSPSPNIMDDVSEDDKSHLNPYPWILLPTQSESIIEMVQKYLERLGIGLDSIRDNNQNVFDFNDADGKSSFPEKSSNLDSRLLKSSNEQPKSVVMAAAYVRLWLALIEVKFKDPHYFVVNAADGIIKKINEQVLTEERKSKLFGENKANNSSSILFENELDNINIPFISLVLPNSVNGSLKPVVQASSFGSIPPLSPLGVATTSMGMRKKKESNNNLSDQANLKPTLSPFKNKSNADFDKKSGNMLSSSLDSSINAFNTLKNNQSHDNLNPKHDDIKPSYWDNIDDNPSLISHLYDWNKKLFLTTDKGYDPYEDELSEEGINRAYRNSRLHEIVVAEKNLSNIFKGIDDRFDHMLDRKAKEEMQLSKASMVASLPQSQTKFEQKSILNVDNSEMTSLVMFHAFHDILAISDSNKVGIWSLTTGNRIMEIGNTLKNKNDKLRFRSNSLKTSSEYQSSSNNRSSFGVKSNNTYSTKSNLEDALAAVRESTLRAAEKPITNTARITAMEWINESYDGLLMLGSDDGTVKVWRDSADSNTVEAANQTGETYGEATLASSFVALPDVAKTNGGSGMVFSWLQHTGNLIVGGNSGSIRVWDVAREQCVRAFTTGLDTCTTALASQSLAPDASGAGGGGESQASLSWTFAGFADGSIGVFDERISSHGGQVHMARDNSAWIVSAHLRVDIPEVITGSVRGVVKFWDLRTMRTFKTFEVSKSPLTALTVHNSAPVMATGSHAQFIKILTLGGDQLGNIIKYHDGFLGQRIGPISCLAFHPTKMILAAGATDSIVSIYSTESYM